MLARLRLRIDGVPAVPCVCRANQAVSPLKVLLTIFIHVQSDRPAGFVRVTLYTQLYSFMHTSPTHPSSQQGIYKIFNPTIGANVEHHRIFPSN